MKNTVEDPEKLGGKISDEEKDTVLEAVKESQEWINSNPDAEKEDFE
jgi:heat shock protein 5